MNYSIDFPRHRSPHWLLRKTAALSFAVLLIGLTGSYIFTDYTAKAEAMESATHERDSKNCLLLVQKAREMGRSVADKLEATCLN